MSTGKKLMNRPDEAVDEALSGLVASRHNLALIEGRRVVVVSPPTDVKGRLAVICGGGSGRPLLGGFADYFDLLFNYGGGGVICKQLTFFTK